MGRNAEAVANFEKAVELGKRADVVLRNLGYAYGIVGRRAEALAIAKELEEKYRKKQSLGQYIAAVYAGLGDKDKAFEWLEKDFETTKTSPEFAGRRSLNSFSTTCAAKIYCPNELKS